MAEKIDMFGEVSCRVKFSCLIEWDMAGRGSMSEWRVHVYCLGMALP